MSLCPEFIKRAAMTDEEFWAHVFRHETGVDPDDDPEPPDVSKGDDRRCNICGEYGACAYDAEGKPMIHVDEEDDDE